MTLISTFPEPTITTATDIWDVAWEIALKLDGFKTYRQGPILSTTQPEELPILCSYLLSDDGSAEGESVTGVPKLRQTVQLGFSGVVVDSDSGTQHRQLAEYAKTLDALLFTNQKMISYDLIRGVENRRVKFVTGLIGQTPTTEFHYIVTLSVLNIWEPVIADKFLRLNESTAFPSGKDDEAARGTLQVKSKWSIPQE